MKEIKFRIWIKNENKMIKISFDNKTAKNQVVPNKSNKIYGLDDIELMHYTGFKDKNGIEIYEGDIVELSRCDNNYCSLKSGEFGIVRFKFGKMMIEPENMKSCCCLMGNFSNCLVVGNIYENKELLRCVKARQNKKS